MRNQRLRSGVSIAVLALSCITFLFVGGVEAFDKYPSLTIVLTNDDGYNSEAIKILRDALVDAGHNVIMVAPATNNSGGSASLTLTDQVILTQLDDVNTYKATATPASCLEIAITYLLEEPPDLVVSGTNIGTNMGRVVTFSGTIGAALTAVFNDLPAIALSTGQPPEELAVEHYTNVADFGVRLIDFLYWSSTTSLLPKGTFLNVNYPLLYPEEIKGIQFTHQNMRPSTIALEYVLVSEDSDTEWTLEASEYTQEAPAPSLGSDEAAYDAGFISLSLMDNNYTAQAWLKSFPDQEMLLQLDP